MRVALAEHEFLTSEVVLAEFRRVLRDKLGAPEAAIDAAIELLCRQHVEPEPTSPCSLGIGDRDDEWVVASALNCSADVFVTGDRELLAIDKIKDLRILSPRGFWELLSR